MVKLVHGESYTFSIDNIFKTGVYTSVDKSFIGGGGIKICEASEALCVDFLSPSLKKMEHKKFSDTKVGDDIFTTRHGWEKCTGRFDAQYGVKTKNVNYTNKGQGYIENKHPSAWTYDPFDGTKPPREFVKGHWYPCIKLSGQPAICKYKGNNTFIDINGIFCNTEQKQIWIGKSLGVIEFPTTFSSLMDGLVENELIFITENL